MQKPKKRKNGTLDTKRKKNNLLKLEKEALLKNHSLSTLQFIYHQMSEFRDLETKKRCKPH